MNQNEKEKEKAKAFTLRPLSDMNHNATTSTSRTLPLAKLLLSSRYDIMP
jgi:hypothetical protein